MIDLAGSEKATSDVERRKEGGYINKRYIYTFQRHIDILGLHEYKNNKFFLAGFSSLLSLGNVISQLIKKMHK